MGSDDEPGDRRKEFEELSRSHPVDESSKRVFLEARIERIREDLRLDPAEKERAIAELRKRFLGAVDDVRAPRKQ
jgi:hypothetical protein